MSETKITQDVESGIYNVSCDLAENCMVQVEQDVSRMQFNIVTTFILSQSATITYEAVKHDFPYMLGQEIALRLLSELRRIVGHRPQYAIGQQVWTLKKYLNSYYVIQDARIRAIHITKTGIEYKLDPACPPDCIFLTPQEAQAECDKRHKEIR